MKLIVDEKVSLRHKLSLNELLLALFIRNDGIVPEVLTNLLNREVLVLRNKKYYITQHWNEVVDEILCDSSGTVDDEERLRELAKKMRECYPQGKAGDSPYYYRCNVSEVVKKLKKFFLMFGDFSDEEILEATKKYVASFRGDYKRLRLIKYFILKDAVKQGEDGMGHVEQVSDLLTYLENSEGEEEVNNDDYWMMNSRN